LCWARPVSASAASSYADAKDLGDHDDLPDRDHYRIGAVSLENAASALGINVTTQWRKPRRYNLARIRGSSSRRLHLDLLTLFGLLSVGAMLVFYTLEDRARCFILLFAGACLSASVYGFLQGAWPFGLI
jgi:hypothetical protein